MLQDRATSLADVADQLAGLVTRLAGLRLQSSQSVTYAPGLICYLCTRIAPLALPPIAYG